MNELAKQMKIAVQRPILKAKLRRAYLAATGWKDQMSCGYRLAIEIRPSIVKNEQRFNAIADELAQIDSDVPTFRFSSALRTKEAG